MECCIHYDSVIRCLMVFVGVTLSLRLAVFYLRFERHACLPWQDMNRQLHKNIKNSAGDCEASRKFRVSHDMHLES